MAPFYRKLCNLLIIAAERVAYIEIDRLNYNFVVALFQGRIARVHEAASDGDLTKLALLLDRPEWAVSRDDSGSTPVQKAMLANHLSVVRFLLHKAPNSLTATDRVTKIHFTRPAQYFTV